MKLQSVLVLGICSITGGTAMAADAASIERGRLQFNRWCVACHAAGLWEGNLEPGTMSLQLKYKGNPPAALEDRTDLTPAVVAYFIRRGIGGMPFFRKTEISDAEMAYIGAYLARNTPK